MKNRTTLQTTNPRQSTAPFQTSPQTLELFRNQLFQELVRDVEDPQQRQRLCQAAREATSLAWTTAFPSLFLPALLTESIHLAKRRLAKQADVKERSKALLQSAGFAGGFLRKERVNHEQQHTS